MERDDRKTIDELITRYSLEPELRDLYVEGPSDKSSLEWFFKQSKCDPVAIFEIDSVDIQHTLLIGYGLGSGNRDEVIALSLEFERLLKQDIPYLLCVADSDFDFLLGRKHNSRYLLYSDYTSIDICFCCEYTLEKFLMLGIRHVPCNAATLLANLAEVLQEIFLIRAANEKLGWGLTWVDFCRSCRITDNTVVFDRLEFIRKYLSKNNRLQDIDKFINVCDQLRKTRVENFKQRIRAHDFFKLVGWYVSRKVGRRCSKYRDPKITRAVFLSSVDTKLLANEEIFKELLKTYHSS